MCTFCVRCTRRFGDSLWAFERLIQTGLDGYSIKLVY